MGEDTALRQADELLAEMIELVETARNLPMSASCVVPRERLLDMLDELREALPPELEESRKVIAARDGLLHAAFVEASETRKNATQDADTIVADATHSATQMNRLAEERVQVLLADAQDEQRRLVHASTVHQVAAEASAALKADAEAYRDGVCGDADAYAASVRAEAENYARDARTEAERYATKLTVDAERYAETTLEDLAATLRKAAGTADQGRLALAERRAETWGDAPEGVFDGTAGAGIDAISA